jgi:hypothetical protein
VKGTAVARRLTGVPRPGALCRRGPRCDRLAGALETHLDVARILSLAGVE